MNSTAAVATFSRARRAGELDDHRPTPANPATAPPGDYLLVVVDGIGVTSEARMIRLAVSAVQPAG